MKSEAGFRPSSRMASKKVEFHEGAALDINSARDRYLQRSESAALRFFDELDRAVGLIFRITSSLAFRKTSNPEVTSSAIPIRSRLSRKVACGSSPRGRTFPPTPRFLDEKGFPAYRKSRFVRKWTSNRRCYRVRRPTNRDHNRSEEGCDVPGHKSQTGQRRDAGLKPGTTQSEQIQERKITGLKTVHYEGKAAAALASNTARPGRRPLQRRSTVVGFGCDIWGTNGEWRSYHPASARVCSKKTYGALRVKMGYKMAIHREVKTNCPLATFFYR
jgi:hypothetical protein